MKKGNRIFIKIAVALTGIALTVVILFFTPLWGTAILLSVLSALCCYELCAATGAVRDAPVTGCGVAAAVFLPWLWYFGAAAYLLPAAALLLLTFAFLYYAAHGRADRSKTIAYFFLAAFVFPAFFSLLLPILSESREKQTVLLPFIAAWSADTGAQLFGKLLGKHKLAPRVSPNKTVEGFFGGLAFGVLGVAIYALVIRLLGKPAPPASLPAFGLLGALFGAAGDLFFSYVKREHGIKDFGALMPEHGGVMDRFDSVVFVLPVFYAYMRVVSF